MEFLAILAIILCAVIFFKLLALVFHVGMFAIALPFKILAIILSTIVVILVLIPLGIIGGLASVFLAPLAILVPLIPIALIIWGIVLLAKNL